MTDNEPVDELKLSALHLSELHTEGRRLLYDEHSASFRWLSASLLAMNGAGLLSLKDVEFTNPTYALSAGAGFYSGVVLALLIAFLGQKSNQRMLDPVARASLYWRRVAQSGKLDEDVQRDIDERTKEAMKFSRWPSRVGVASLVAFSIGMAAVALGWHNPSSEKTKATTPVSPR